MTCPCSNPCPDDGEFIPVTPISPDTPLPTETLDSDECCTGGCGCGCGCPTGCHDNCGINIQSTSECLTVDTSECGVVKLTPICPPEVVAGDNVTVDVVDSPREGYSKRYIVNSECEDTKVKVKECGDAGYLADKVSGSNGLIVTPSCDELNLSIDWSKDPNHCEEIPPIIIENASELINASVGGADGHTIHISDANQKYAYGKIRLKEDIYETFNGKQEPYKGHDKSNRYVFADVHVKSGDGGLVPKRIKCQRDYQRDELLPGLQNIIWDDNVGCMRVKIRGLYVISYDGTVEVGSGVHAFRAQLYSSNSNEEGEKRTKTILESRYSAPTGWTPPYLNKTTSGYSFPESYKNPPSFVTGVTASGGGEDPVKLNVSYGKMDKFMPSFPVWQLEPDLRQNFELGMCGGSLGSYASRFHVGGCTIAELDVGDYVFFGLKVSNSINFGGESGDSEIPQANVGVPDNVTTDAKFAVLCYNSQRSGAYDIGGEPGLTISLSLVVPLGPKSIPLN